MEELNSLEEIFEAVENCEKCKLHEFRDKCVFAEGKNNANIMLVGLSPGRQENLSGRLFVGPSGDFLNELLQLAGLDRNELYITNIIKCHAPTYAIGPKEISACSIYLDKQIDIVNPKVIIALGSVAGRYILEKYNIANQKVSDIHGQVFSVSMKDLFSPDRTLKIIPMFHPAAALRSEGLLELVKKDWQNLGEKL